MIAGLGRVLRRVRGKSMRTIAVRGAQELRLELMARIGAWARIERRGERWWDDARVAAYMDDGGPRVLAPDGAVALAEAADGALIDATALGRWAENFRTRRFAVLNADVPSEGPWPWHSDWRYGKTWAPDEFRRYDVYEPRAAPYDVKYPWELSRLGFVLPLLQQAALTGEKSWHADVLAILRDWKAANPLAWSINWAPMEASMRAINLVYALDLALCARADAALIRILLQLASAHGAFIARTVEDGDIRGNHYAANVVALYLLGIVLARHDPAAARWRRYARARLEREILLQFLPDGVNFEKSVAYHRLVLELFLVAALAAARADEPIGVRARDRLRAACAVLRCLLRPDGRLPAIGDSDDASALGFDRGAPFDPLPVFTVAAALLGGAAVKPREAAPSYALCWLGGRAGVSAWQSLAVAPPAEYVWLRDGGFVSIRGQACWFAMDVGEVGLAGRGGHGHNDLLGFELALRGVPVIVDPGTYTYTGDRSARDWFRGTAGHNGASVDGLEMAPFKGPFRIGDEARPIDLSIEREGGIWRVEAGHTGYRRLDDPVTHHRRIALEPAGPSLECVDRFVCRGAHVVRRYLHMDPAVDIVLRDGSTELLADGHRYTVTWNGAARAAIEPGWVSAGYGLRTPASVLVLADAIEGDASLEFRIRAADDKQ